MLEKISRSLSHMKNHKVLNIPKKSQIFFENHLKTLGGHFCHNFFGNRNMKYLLNEKNIFSGVDKK